MKVGYEKDIEYVSSYDLYLRHVATVDKTFKADFGAAYCIGRSKLEDISPAPGTIFAVDVPQAA
jgi:hypothetical protein